VRALTTRSNAVCDARRKARLAARRADHTSDEILKGRLPLDEADTASSPFRMIRAVAALPRLDLGFILTG